MCFEGSFGSGKSLGAAMMAWAVSAATGCRVASNMPLAGEFFPWSGGVVDLRDVEGFVALAAAGGGVAVLDELPVSLDSRRSQTKQQVWFTEFLMYLRKIGVSLLYTAQSVDHQVDVRVREVTDLVVACERVAGGFSRVLYRGLEGFEVGRSFLPADAAWRWYGLYDTKAVVPAVRFPEDEKGYSALMAALAAAVPRAPLGELEREGRRWLAEVAAQVAARSPA